MLNLGFLYEIPGDNSETRTENIIFFPRFKFREMACTVGGNFRHSISASFLDVSFGILNIET